MAEHDPWAGGWEALQELARRRGEDLTGAYRERLRHVWRTREVRVRGFRGVPGHLPGECARCYRLLVEQGGHVCPACREADPEFAARADEMGV